LIVNFRGQYVNSLTYNQQDVVTYNNYNFMCLVNNTTGIAPVVGQDTATWVQYNTTSTFPSSIDSFVPKTNIQPSDVQNVTTYQNLLTSLALTPPQQDQLNQLAANLSNKLLFPQDINQIQQAVQNLEIFFLNNVQGYINTMQNNVQTFVNNMETSVDNYVNTAESNMNNYVNTAESNVNSYISTMQNNFSNQINQFNYKGVWSATTQYYTWNLITYNGNVYIAKQNNLNVAPTTGDQNDPNWLLLSRVGATGPQGPPGVNLTFVGVYSNSTAYSVNQVVAYDSNPYVCIQNTTPGIDPSNTAYWTLFASYTPIPVISTAPTNPALGQVWIDSSNNQIKYWNGSTWVIVGTVLPTDLAKVDTAQVFSQQQTFSAGINVTGGILLNGSLDLSILTLL